MTLKKRYALVGPSYEDTDTLVQFAMFSTPEKVMEHFRIVAMPEAKIYEVTFELYGVVNPPTLTRVKP